MHNLCSPDQQRFCKYALEYKHLLYIVVLIFLLSFPKLVQSDQVQIYRTLGSGKIETCKGIGFEVCSSEEITLPKLIDQAKSPLNGIRHEKKRDYTMCYMDLEQGIWTKKFLLFRCIPVR